MTDLLALSERVIETGEIDGPVNRINHELSIISDDIAMVEAFSHSIIFKTEEGLVVFDTSGPQGGARVVEGVIGGGVSAGWRGVRRTCRSRPCGRRSWRMGRNEDAAISGSSAIGAT